MSGSSSPPATRSPRAATAWATTDTPASAPGVIITCAGSVGSPRASYDAATAAWNNDAHVETRRRVFGEKRDLFTAFFEEVGLEYLPTEASFYLWVAVPDGDDEAYALRLMEEGVIVAPGRAFGAGGEGYVRIALVPGLEDCKLAIQRWAGIEG